ncbi:hypothetical protein [Sphingomonas turrisvirgatae]|uniref:Uncharacterized protein n=1 Tax=Sphingomonas turrisvirgatae TaxID=1888892 RepID=A0A1E3LQQ6_9SPHN|nr:hypothetical protein [Sphingomonas turrisvirgatae]ODP36081.1 hypothetical protein BFL28_08340 [Sphingomonas turrisvirgatae]
MGRDSSADAVSRRYHRMFRLVGAIAFASAVLAVGALYLSLGEFQLHASIAMAIGIGLSVLLGGVLMGLIFVSNASGHDDRAG